MRYLEHALRHTPELRGSGDLEVRASWASGTAILNALVVLLATDCTTAGQDAGSALILPTLSEQCREQLFKLEVEDELDGILAEDCPFCGQVMINTIMKPFIDPAEAGEAEEIESWAI
eukprot:Skav209906  [mRNA]  locus=scaffold1253:7430:11563:- [translate_table: standard]